MAKTTDVAIVGGGVIGCFIAYYLSKEGIEATVFEQTRFAVPLERALDVGEASGLDGARAVETSLGRSRALLAMAQRVRRRTILLHQDVVVENELFV